MSHGADSVKSIFFALGANLAIAVAKLVAAVITGSGAMKADMPSAEALIKAVNRCEVELKKAFPQVVWSFFEPDLKD